MLMVIMAFKHNRYSTIFSCKMHFIIAKVFMLVITIAFLQLRISSDVLIHNKIILFKIAHYPALAIAFQINDSRDISNMVANIYSLVIFFFPPVISLSEHYNHQQHDVTRNSFRTIRKLEIYQHMPQINVASKF